MRSRGDPARVVITFACPPDRCRAVILALAAMTMTVATVAAAMAALPRR